MFSNTLVQVGLFLTVLLLVTKPMGLWIVNVMNGNCKIINRLSAPFERLIYRTLGTSPDTEMGWKQYAIALLLFNLVGVAFVYILQRWQVWLPLNPQHFSAVSVDSSFNTAISFVTNTNWQGYSGETTMSYLSQMLGLTVQNFLSAATGIAVVFALIRGFARHTSKTIGNFWVDMTRSTLYILLPLSFVFAIALMGQGVIQNFDAYKEVSTLQPTTYSTANEAGQLINQTANTQTLAMGPVASQEAIKMIGTNGGGFFNTNSAHPFENPTPLSNFLQMLAIFLIPAGLCFAFGMMVGDRRQGWAVFSAMAIVFVVMAAVAISAEQAGNPILTASGADQTVSVSQSGMALQSGGNMEGKETRFGIVSSALFATVTTAASCGAVNTMHDSLTPIGGLVPMWLIQLGEVIFGGVGSGLYTMLIYAVLAVFIAGLMIGRTPEYLGKKIEIFDMKMTAIIILVTPLLVLIGTAIAVSVTSGTVGVANPGAHGFSEMLYALSSAANNNGSAFAGLSANTPFYNTLLAFAMFFGRFGIILPVLAIAGSMAAKKRIPVSLGTMPTHGALFVTLLIGAVILVGALTYIPALALGPVIEHLLMVGV
ncbi:potassium-transporting ATPase subunit KdpA [Methylotenera mobilis]|uniref:Potassium-transporting ATPase potassium-binding subunit n=1 Tax=Methylotenera mobilis (strain JLW8 / ATCC BAA-1282 / DSM 17540) TaxID=583345 RepID=C6WWR2_METML|nr:potassium-transporting ATPase subunit KdpA [Methylotenera mobilis]ACT48361.1 potassium-transporting ATPase, A subunit [Methylotenera mobilis JLW8]